MNKNDETINLKGLMIVERSGDKFFFSYPKDLSNNTLSEMKNIYFSFKDVNSDRTKDNGKVSSKDGIFNFFKLPNGLIYITFVSKYYKETTLTQFVDKLEEIFKEKKKFVENGSPELSVLSREETLRIIKIFETYKYLNSDGSVIKDYTNDDFFNFSGDFIDSDRPIEKIKEIPKQEFEGEVTIL